MNLVKYRNNKLDPFDWDIDNFINKLFYSFPKEPTKPPLTISYCDSDGERVKLQLAVAGFKEEDIKIFYEQNNLYLEGSNQERDNVPDKFKVKFSYKIPVSENVDISAAEVSLLDGILTVSIPLIKPEAKRTYLLNKDPTT